MRVRKLLTLCAVLITASGCVSTPRKVSSDTLPLEDVISSVTKALERYQSSRGSGDLELPPLSSAEFDFKTSTAKSGGVSISLLIFKFGTSHEKDVVNDVTFTYSLPPPVKILNVPESKAPPTLSDQLAQTIQDAARAVKASSTAAGLPFSKLTVNLSYGVKWDVNADGKKDISIVTLDLNGDVSKNTVQSVKLIFGK